MKRLVLIAAVMTPIAIVVLLLYSGSGAAADIAAKDNSPRFSSAFRVMGTLTLPHKIYLPLESKSFPSPIQVPQGKYLLVEYWTHRVLGMHCHGLCVDFPTYYFDVQSGELDIYTVGTPSPGLVLGDDDIGYAGIGLSISGTGCGVNSHLTKISSCPFSRGNITLYDVDEAGTTSLGREGRIIVLKAGETWLKEEVETWESNHPQCVITNTHRITNHAFQDRDKITFAP